MTYRNNTPWEKREYARLANSLRTDADLTDGVLRWNSNGRVPPSDCIEVALAIGIPVNVAKCDKARDIDTDAFFAEYRKNYKGPSDEDRFEARAAFGPGHELVNVITGHKWTT